MSAPLMTAEEVVADRAPNPSAGASWAKASLLACVPVAACILSYFVCTSAFFERHADPQWVRAGSQIYVARDVDCQVLIYGDSTAITGIDPGIVARLTGLKTCNVAQTKGALVVLGTQALDLYLAHNRRPRVLLLQFSGADFYRPENWADTNAYMEGGIALLRYYPAGMVAANILRHPALLLGMMHYAYITGPLNWIEHRHTLEDGHSSPETPIDIHFVLNLPGFTACAQDRDTDPIFHRPDPRFIAYLRRHYGAAADHLIVDVAPTSTCDDRAPYIRQTLTGIDNSLEQYPVTLFNEGYAHYTEEGARRLSAALGRQIAAVANAEDR